MADEQPPTPGAPQASKAAAPDPKKGGPAKQLSLAEYKALQDKEAKQFKLVIPSFVWWILGIPVILIGLFGLFYIPFAAIRGCSSDNTQQTSK